MLDSFFLHPDSGSAPPGEWKEPTVTNPTEPWDTLKGPAWTNIALCFTPGNVKKQAPALKLQDLPQDTPTRPYWITPDPHLSAPPAALLGATLQTTLFNYFSCFIYFHEVPPNKDTDLCWLTLTSPGFPLYPSSTHVPPLGTSQPLNGFLNENDKKQGINQDLCLCLNPVH